MEIAKDIALIGIGCVAGMSALIGWRRPRTRKATPAVANTKEYLPILREIDKMILSNMSLTAIAQAITDVIGETSPFLGSLIRSIDEKDGSLTVLAASKNLQASATEQSLHDLRNRTLTPAQMQINRSLTGQAINERRMAMGEHLRDFEYPLLTPTEADRLQAALGIGSIAVYPIVVEDRLHGAMTFYFARPLDRLTEHDRALMQALADETGIALENSELLGQMENMNRRLEESNLHLRTLDATKDEFISITSHQLRSPLTAIKGYLSMLLDRDFGPVGRVQEPVLRQISQSTTEIINVLNDLLSVSKINAENFELNRTPVNLEDLVSDVAVELKPLATEKGLTLKVMLPREPIGVVYVDPLRLRQVVINFTDNAIKYTDHGLVEIRLSATADTITCTVKDSGIGIPRRELSQMFTKFYRAANARKVITLGTGLGLFVAKKVVEDHQGAVIVKSSEGKGSTFGFTLPRTALTQPKALEAPLQGVGADVLS